MARILIIDADAEVREVLAYVFAHEGFCAQSANQADTALRMAQAHPPDGLVTALKLQPIDGAELIQQLRRLPGCRDLPAVVFTALARHEVLERFGGALPRRVALVSKGGKPSRVVEVMRRLLDESSGASA
jgi:putative two-component system response regulator